MIAPYIGIPFVERGRSAAGCDCYGLVTLFYRERFQIELPDGTDFEKDRGPEWGPVGKPEYGDVLVFRINGVEAHCGIHVGPGARMLHTMSGTCSVIERYDDRRWAPRFSRAFRHIYRIGSAVLA